MGRGRSGGGRGARIVVAKKQNGDFNPDWYNDKLLDVDLDEIREKVSSDSEMLRTLAGVSTITVSVDDGGNRKFSIVFKPGVTRQEKADMQTTVLMNYDAWETELKNLDNQRRQVVIFDEIQRMRDLGAYEKGVGGIANGGSRSRQRSTHEAAATKEGIKLVSKTLLPINSRPRLVLVEGSDWELRAGGKDSTVYARGKANGLRRYAKDMGAPVGLIVQFTGDDSKPVANVFRGVKQTDDMTVEGKNPLFSG